MPYILVESLSKSDKKYGSYKTFCLKSAETNFAKFMILTSTLVYCHLIAVANLVKMLIITQLMTITKFDTKGAVNQKRCEN